VGQRLQLKVHPRSIERPWRAPKKTVVTRDAGAADGPHASGSADNVSGKADETSVKAYETLRCQVLTGSTVDRPAGLVVLLRHGVAAWRARRSTPTAARCFAPAPATPPVAGERHDALVRVLVDMVLPPGREVYP